MESTVSAYTTSFNWNTFSSNPFIQYILSPAIVFSILGFILYKVLDIGKILQKLNQSFDDIKDLEKDVKKLLSHMDIVKTHLVNKTGLDSKLFSPGSPLVLKPRGIQLLNATGFKKIYERDKDFFLDKFKEENVKTLTDIDETSIKILDSLKDDTKFSNFREIAFENGTTVEVLFKVCSIYLRDEVAKETLKKEG